MDPCFSLSVCRFASFYMLSPSFLFNLRNCSCCHVYVYCPSLLFYAGYFWTEQQIGLLVWSDPKKRAGQLNEFSSVPPSIVSLCMLSVNNKCKRLDNGNKNGLKKSCHYTPFYGEDALAHSTDRVVLAWRTNFVKQIAQLSIAERTTMDNKPPAGPATCSS